MLNLDPSAEGYGLTPLDLAPEPGSRRRSLFTDARLDRRLASQQPDGGWPLSRDSPSETSVLEWRGMVTLRVLQTATAYGRLDAAS